jgi:hypothetical protein
MKFLTFFGLSMLDELVACCVVLVWLAGRLGLRPRRAATGAAPRRLARRAGTAPKAHLI